MRSCSACSGFLITLLGVLAPLSPAQAQPPGPLHFDAASIRAEDPATDPRERSNAMTSSGRKGNRAAWRAQPLYAMIVEAWGIPAWYLLGDIENIRRTFTTEVTMPVTTTKEEFQAMLRNLLTERFHLAVHHETRNFPGFEMVLLPGGVKMKEWQPDPSAPAVGDGPPGQPGFGLKLQPETVRAHIAARLSMAEFVKKVPGFVFMSENIRGDVERDEALRAGVREYDPGALQMVPVVDKTGLSGIYEFTLDFEGHFVPLPSKGGPTIFTALEKQLGLKLVRAKVPMEVLVIDHIDRLPTEN